MRKRAKSKGTALDVSTGPLSNILSGAAAENSGLNSVDALPNETLQLMFAKLPFPSRQHASLVCRRWRDLLLEAPFCRHVAPSQSLSEALQACSPGDTLICPPGMYQETLLVDKPVRVVAEDHWRAEQRQRRRRSRGLALEPQQQQGASSPQQQQQQPKAAIEAGSGPGPSAAPEAEQRQAQDVLNPQQQQQQRLGPCGGSGRQRGGPGGGGGGARPAVQSVTVISLRPPVVVMDSRCCFVGFEFHTSVAHNEVSICCFGPNSPMARFERCTFSGLTGLRVPYSKGSQTRLELYDCTLIGTTQSLAAVQMDAGRLLLARCVLQNNAVGVEVGPEALALLADCEVRWCCTALVVDGCLAMANCRLWGNGKVGNVSTETRLRAAQSLSEACLAAGALGGQHLTPSASPQADPQQQHTRPSTGSPTRAPRAAAAAARAAVAAAAVAAASPPKRGRGRRGAGAAAAAGDAAGGNAQAGGSTAAATAAPADAAAAIDGTMASGSAASELGGAGALQAQQQVPPSSAAGTAAAVAAVSAAGGGSGSGPARVAALAAAQRAEVEAAFSARQQLVRVVGCEVAAPQPIMRTGLHKDVRKKARELVRQVYGAPDVDLFPEWEVLVQSDLDSDLDDEDSSVNSGSVMGDGDEDDLEDDDLDPLDAADDPDLDESGESHSGSDSDSDSGSGSGSGSGDEGDAREPDIGGAGGGDDGGGEMEEEDEEYNAGDPMSSGSSSSSAESSSSSDSDSSNDSDSDNSGESGSSGGGSSSSSGDGSESD